MTSPLFPYDALDAEIDAVTEDENDFAERLALRVLEQQVGPEGPALDWDTYLAGRKTRPPES